MPLELAEDKTVAVADSSTSTFIYSMEHHVPVTSFVQYLIPLLIPGGFILLFCTRRSILPEGGILATVLCFASCCLPTAVIALWWIASSQACDYVSFNLVVTTPTAIYCLCAVAVSLYFSVQYREKNGGGPKQRREIKEQQKLDDYSRIVKLEPSWSPSRGALNRAARGHSPFRVPLTHILAQLFLSLLIGGLIVAIPHLGGEKFCGSSVSQVLSYLILLFSFSWLCYLMIESVIHMGVRLVCLRNLKKMMDEDTNMKADEWCLLRNSLARFDGARRLRRDCILSVMLTVLLVESIIVVLSPQFRLDAFLFQILGIAAVFAVFIFIILAIGTIINSEHDLHLYHFRNRRWVLSLENFDQSEDRRLANMIEMLVNYPNYATIMGVVARPSLLASVVGLILTQLVVLTRSRIGI